jgi:hypothetical protein
MPLEIASSMESLATSAAVSKSKISKCLLMFTFPFYAYDFVDIPEACNKNILLWRIFEHKNPIHWAELDLKNVYTCEVQPHGYTFPFELIIRSLHYERFVQNILGEVGSRTFAFNRNKVTNYVKNIQPLAPPPASPKKNKREKSGFCCCC